MVDFEGDDSSLIKAFQEIENRTSTKENVFQIIIQNLFNSQDLKSLVQSTKFKNAENKAKWAVNIFYEWKEERNESLQTTKGLNSACVVGEHDHGQYEVR